MTRDTLFAFQNLDHQFFGISSQSGCMSVVFLFACMGRGRYVSRYKMYTGDGQASKKRRSLWTSLENQPGGEEVTPAELLPCGISFSLSSFGLVFSQFTAVLSPSAFPRRFPRLRTPCRRSVAFSLPGCVPPRGGGHDSRRGHCEDSSCGA